MEERRWKIGICGTFDVANYGDLLFPLIAERELSERLGAVTLQRFSYNARTPTEWPYEVTSIAALPEMIQRLDGLLIGGGFLIRFDKHVAPGYVPPNPETHHPTGYWLTPALLALQHDVPLVWNAPGMHCNDIPAWATPLLEMALTLSRYVAVRDEPTRSALEPLTSVPVAVVPDTGFGIPRLLNLQATPSAEFRRLSEGSGLDRPYIVIQATLGLEGFVRFLKNHPRQFGNFQFLAVPIGPVFGEHQEIIDADLPGIVRLAEWPSPLVLAELIGRSEAAVGHSYHLITTALAAGVPVFTPQNLSTGKYSILKPFETISVLPSNGQPDVEWFLVRLGRRGPSDVMRAWRQQLRDHWDRVAAALRAESERTAPTLNRFWQSLPILLEGNGLDGAPLLRNGKPHVLSVNNITLHQLETEPYQWAVIENLFSPDHSAELAATFPCDHFKLVAAQGGEKDYEYEARELIGMGADAITHPGDLSDVWQGLANDLLAPGYRAALTTLTGCDLSQALMEVNVFHYGPGALLGPHPDLPEKLVTHVLYFNESWNRADGGCLSILRSADPTDLVAEISPIVGSSAVIVRSDNSWHAVSRVVNDSASSRRSVTVTFYRPDSVSSMWPPDDATPTYTWVPDRATRDVVKRSNDDVRSQFGGSADPRYWADVGERNAEIVRLQDVLAQQTEWNLLLRDHAAKGDAEIVRLQEVLCQQTEWNLQLRDHAANADAEIVRLQEVLTEQAARNLDNYSESPPPTVASRPDGLFAAAVKRLYRLIKRSPFANSAGP
jgi:hypothetical protein